MATSKQSNPADAVGADQVQAKFDEADEKGFFGYSPDDTPRDNYTLQTPQDAETPETKARNELAAKRKADREAGK